MLVHVVTTKEKCDNVASSIDVRSKTTLIKDNYFRLSCDDLVIREQCGKNLFQTSGSCLTSSNKGFNFLLT